jgi:VWFA-related protein
MGKKTFFFFFLWVILSSLVFPQHEETLQDSLEFHIDVYARVIPFFAVDKKGNPVYNLEEKDIELLINGKPFSVLSFSRYEFQSDAPGLKETIPLQTRYPERFVFIIIDYMFNSKSGIKQSKIIVNEIMQRSSPGDAFILLANTPAEGLQYLFGPEKEKKKMAKAIKAMSFHNKGNKDLTEAQKNLRRMKQRVTGFYDASSTTYSTSRSKFSSLAKEIQAKEIRRAQKAYQAQKEEIKILVKKFRRAISSLKYALRSITASKIIYLISEGIPIGSIEDDKSKIHTEMIFYFDQLKQIAKSVNLGGSILNIVNSSKLQLMDFDENSGKQSLKYIAEESGGKYFGGSDITKIVSRIKKSTAAYYEISFTPDKLSRERIRIKIKCKKPGVTIHSIVHSEKQRPYRKMEALQKKIFALNIITGGSWSRMVGKVEKTRYKKIKSKGKKSRQIEVVIPLTMKNRKVDIFIVHLDPLTMKADFELSQKKVKEKESLEFQMAEERNHYFVIIDPVDTICIYNQVN